MALGEVLANVQRTCCVFAESCCFVGASHVMALGEATHSEIEHEEAKKRRKSFVSSLLRVSGFSESATKHHLLM
jgi:hypothetical protein